MHKKQRRTLAVLYFYAGLFCGSGLVWAQSANQENQSDDAQKLFNQTLTPNLGEEFSKPLQEAQKKSESLTLSVYSPPPAPPTGLLESGFFDVYSGKSMKKMKKVERREDISEDCSLEGFGYLNDIFTNSDTYLSLAAAKISAINSNPIPLYISNETKKKGWFRKQQILGQFDPTTGSISLYCHRFKWGHASYASMSDDGANTLMHEMGHMLMFRAYGNDLPTKKYEGHVFGILKLTNPETAWAEAFADFFELALHPSNTYSLRKLFSSDTDPIRPDDIRKRTRGETIACGLDSILYGMCHTDETPETLTGSYKDMYVFRMRPWKEKIASEQFVFAALAYLAADSSQKKEHDWDDGVHTKDGRWPVDTEKINKLLRPILQAKDMPGGMHKNFDEYLRHYVQLFPEEKPRVKAVLNDLFNNKAPLPDWLEDSAFSETQGPK